MRSSPFTSRWAGFVFVDMLPKTSTQKAGFPKNVDPKTLADAFDLLPAEEARR
jgi:hypothetical protein